MSARHTTNARSHRISAMAAVACWFGLFGCIRDVPIEVKTKEADGPKIAVKPETDKLDAAVKSKDGDVVAGLQELLGPLKPGENHTTIFLNSDGKIEAIDLSGHDLTAEGLKHLTKLNDSLRRISLNDVYITDEALEVLSHISNLRKLELNRTPVSDEGLAHLTKLTQLRELSLKGTKVTDDGIVKLSQLKELRMLSLSGTSVSSESLAALAELPELNTLLLNETPVTNDGLRALRQFPRLQFLHLTGSKVKPSALAKFRREKRGINVTGP